MQRERLKVVAPPRASLAGGARGPKALRAAASEESCYCCVVYPALDKEPVLVKTIITLRIISNSPRRHRAVFITYYCREFSRVFGRMCAPHCFLLAQNTLYVAGLEISPTMATFTSTMAPAHQLSSSINTLPTFTSTTSIDYGRHERSSTIRYCPTGGGSSSRD